MNININIKNIEDINYINSLNENEIENILNTAISIGLKSIQMSNTFMNGNSYFEPLKDIINENNNKHEIDNISNMLKDLMNIKNNSSRKGKLGESLAMNSLIKKYPDWIIEDTTGISHEADIYAYSSKYGKILYEIKTYSTNVNNKEIQKFKNDIITTNSNYGIFVSQTSGIVGKKLMDYEIYNDKIIIYVSCAGLNGHGIEFGTEFLLCLIDMGYTNKKCIIENKKVNDILDIINDNMLELNECINNFSRCKSQLQELRISINNNIDVMHKNLLEYEVKGNILYEKILNIIKVNYENKENICINNNIVLDYINNLKDDYKKLFINIKKRISNYTWGLNKDANELYIIDTNNNIIYKFIIKDINILCIFNIQNKKNVSLDINYEEISNNNILLNINNYDIYIENIIINKLS